MLKLYFGDFTIRDLKAILNKGYPVYMDWDKQYMIVDTDFIK